MAYETIKIITINNYSKSFHIMHINTKIHVNQFNSYTSTEILYSLLKITEYFQENI